MFDNFFKIIFIFDFRFVNHGASCIIYKTFGTRVKNTQYRVVMEWRGDDINARLVVWIMLISLCHSDDSQHYIVCPIQCRCNVTSLSIDCSGQHFEKIPIISSFNVRSLNLSHNTIQNISRDDLSQLTDIVSIDLSYNIISNISLLAFSENRNLQYVNLKDNLLTHIPLFSGKESGVDGSQKSQLKELNLAGNALRVPELTNFARVIMLETLDLSRNNLSHRLWSLLTELPNLKRLKISDNQLVDISYDASMFPHPLEELDLSKNFIRGKLTLSANLPNLTILNLTGNMISSLDSFPACELPSLNTLLLSRNLIETLQDGIFMDCSKLKRLELAHMKDLVHVDPGAFRGLQHLRVLELYGNSLLTGLDSDVFQGLSQLESLDLHSNSLEVLRLDAFVLQKSNLGS